MNASITAQIRQQLVEEARQVLHQTWAGHYSQTASSNTPFHSNFTAGFNALGYMHFDMDKAEEVLRHIFNGQWSNGMLPHQTFPADDRLTAFLEADFWNSKQSTLAPKTIKTSGITTPPIYGFILLEMYKHTEQPEKTLAFLEEMYPKVLAHHRYLYRYRNPTEEGLIHICHPWESGIFKSPIWDIVLAKLDLGTSAVSPKSKVDLNHHSAKAIGFTQLDLDHSAYLADFFRKHNYDDEAISTRSPFKVQDPFFNSLLVWSNESLIEMGSMLSEDVSEIVEWNELTIYSMDDKLWNEESCLFDAWDLKSDKRINTITSSGLTPVIGLIPTQEQAEEMLLKLESSCFSGLPDEPLFWCPSYHHNQEINSTQKNEHGPVSILLNWLLYRGLLRYDMTDEAERLRNDSLQLLSSQKFSAFFDPRKSQIDNIIPEDIPYSYTAALAIDFLNIDS